MRLMTALKRCAPVRGAAALPAGTAAEGWDTAIPEGERSGARRPGGAGENAHSLPAHRKQPKCPVCLAPRPCPGSWPRGPYGSRP
ncbi:hypothetical protein GCM10010253_02120 [Streptomyces badius]|uniref:4Fe-4S Wbl-type domain-containing protein n=1 Tax=Streptomyces badius TaxID=1941 RepID=A0ABQ2SKD5_STRBA|nr:hypothetical protein GCM10010253_02120 [Streptomyces badius]